YAFEDNPLVHLTPTDVDRLRPLALDVARRWDELPDGGCLLVRWPGHGALPEEADPLVYGPSTLPAPHRIIATASTPSCQVAVNVGRDTGTRTLSRKRRPRRAAVEDRRARHRRRCGRRPV